MQQTCENAKYFHLGHLDTARSARNSKTSNSHSPTSLQRNSILPNRGIQNVPKLQPILHPKSQSYPGNSLMEVKCSQGQWKPNFRLRPRHNHCHRCLHKSWVGSHFQSNPIQDQWKMGCSGKRHPHQYPGTEQDFLH